MSLKNMENDDFFVVIVSDTGEKQIKSEIDLDIKEEPIEATEVFGVEDIIETAEKHGEVLPVELIKDEPSDEDSEEEFYEEFLNEDSDNEDETDESRDHSTPKRKRSRGQRHSMLKPWQRKSFIDKLRQKHPELDTDDLLIDKLCRIMRSVRPPPPPQDYFIINDTMFECIKCGAKTQTIPAAERHYQEKHGPRYLKCYACGVDFRSKTNLYRHEKSCQAPDAMIMLKARANYLGRKGQNRPYLKDSKFKLSSNPLVKRLKRRYIDTRTFPCTRCSATFPNNNALQAHINLHMGVRPYQCDQCSAAYTSRTGLTRHMKWQHSGLVYTCDHCRRSFNKKSGLVTHMDTHNSVRRYVCSECGRRYAQNADLKRHVNKIHLKLPAPNACSLCPNRYYKMSVLKEHMKKMHGMSLMTRNMFLKKLPTLTETEFDAAKVVLQSELVPKEDLNYVFVEQKVPGSTNKKLKADVVEKANKKINFENSKIRRKSQETIQYFAIPPTNVNS